MDLIKDKTMLVGFGHKARMGKGTVVSTIYEMYKDQYNILVTGFGDALKEELNQVDQFEMALKLGIDYDFKADLTDPLCSSKHGKQSKLLQAWGQMKRQQDPFYWVKKVQAKIVEAKPTICLIHDMRYRNEYYFVKSVGGYTVRVRRQGFIDLSRDPKHISETDLDSAEFHIDINVLDGELDQLKKDAITSFEILLKHETPEIPDIEGVAIVESISKPMVVLA